METALWYTFHEKAYQTEGEILSEWYRQVAVTHVLSKAETRELIEGMENVDLGTVLGLKPSLETRQGTT